MPKASFSQRIALAAVLAAVAVALFRAQSNRPTAGVAQQAPDFRLADMGGRTVALSDYRGKVVLLNFWASWCDSCKEEMPALNELYKRRKGDFELLAASVDQGGRKDVMGFMARYEPDFPVVLADMATQSAYGVHDLPTSFLIGPDGLIERRYIGPIDPKVLENDILGLKSGSKKT